MIYEWKPRKAAVNLRKHGVHFSEASSVFLDAMAWTFEDPDHSDEEDREITIEMSVKGRVLFVAYAARGDRVRLISARKATAKERRQYAERISERIEG